MHKWVKYTIVNGKDIDHKRFHLMIETVKGIGLVCLTRHFDKRFSFLIPIGNQPIHVFSVEPVMIHTFIVSRRMKKPKHVNHDQQRR